MENLQAEVKGKVQLLDFTLGKTNEVLESNSTLAIKSYQEAVYFCGSFFFANQRFFVFLSLHHQRVLKNTN